MLSGTPYYIIVGEFLLIMGFAVLARSARQRSLARVVGAGVVAGLGIFAAYFVAWHAVLLVSR